MFLLTEEQGSDLAEKIQNCKTEEDLADLGFTGQRQRISI